MSVKSGQKIPLRLFVLTGALAASLAVVTAFTKKDAIEAGLTHQVRKALSRDDLPIVNVSFSGRVATLTGSVNDQALVPKIERTTSGVFGVQRVHNQLEAVSTEVVYATVVAEPEFKNGFYVPPTLHPLEKYKLDKVQFVYAQATLVEDAYPVLDRLARLLGQNPSIQIELSVHTDNQGTPLGQIMFSEVRANTIRDYLISKAVKAEQVIATGYGSTRPIASNENNEGRTKNRRVELRVLKD